MLSHTSTWVWEATLAKHSGPTSLRDLVSFILRQSLSLSSSLAFSCSAPNSGANSCNIHFTVSIWTSFQFSQWEELAWYLEGEKPGVFLLFSICFRLHLLQWLHLSCGFNSCKQQQLPTRQCPLWYQVSSGSSEGPPAPLAPSALGMVPSFCFTHLWTLFLLFVFQPYNCFVTISLH